ncbi:MAG: 4-(cytidine 5'-diphospho)-2-C-methyl-D-erythritol kinase [Alphaproteobacteria bacterium]|nr:4-(cytidine 5'-diphospho)-2-C-methyl-D-erythritol kinase [Alphaproteobacteria bacterium]
MADHLHSITLLAPAKVNLTLAITGRRDDGYHTMQSLVMFAALADTISLTALDDADEDELIIHGNDALAAMPGNIMLKAASAYRAATGHAQRFGLTLTKAIPMAAGVGGGSADAAATLLAINAFFGHALTDDELAQLGLSLGADVPVCLGGHRHLTWRMEGIGDRLTAVDFPLAHELGIILTNPGVDVPTGPVFQHLRPDDFRAHQPKPDDIPTAEALKNWLDDGNSLTRPACALQHIIPRHLDALSALNSHDGYLASGMSGSGATCFALFTSKAAALNAAKGLPASLDWVWAGGMFDPSSSVPGRDE